MNQDRRTFLRNSALVGGAVAFDGLSGNAQVSPASARGTIHPLGDAADSESVRRLFQSPPKKFRPIARWWWPGDDVSDSELRREIDVLDKAGFGGAEIQAFVKGFPTNDLSSAQLDRVNGFATPPFFSHVAVAV